MKVIFLMCSSCIILFACQERLDSFVPKIDVELAFNGLGLDCGDTLKLPLGQKLKISQRGSAEFQQYHIDFGDGSETYSYLIPYEYTSSGLFKITVEPIDARLDSACFFYAKVIGRNIELESELDYIGEFLFETDASELFIIHSGNNFWIQKYNELGLELSTIETTVRWFSSYDNSADFFVFDGLDNLFISSEDYLTKLDLEGNLIFQSRKYRPGKYIYVTESEEIINLSSNLFEGVFAEQFGADGISQTRNQIFAGQAGSIRDAIITEDDEYLVLLNDSINTVLSINGFSGTEKLRIVLPETSYNKIVRLEHGYLLYDWVTDGGRINIHLASFDSFFNFKWATNVSLSILGVFDPYPSPLIFVEAFGATYLFHMNYVIRLQENGTIERQSFFKSEELEFRSAILRNEKLLALATINIYSGDDSGSGSRYEGSYPFLLSLNPDLSAEGNF